MSYPVINACETGKNIKKKMAEKNISPNEVMAFLGIAEKSSLYKWFRGERIPSLDNMLALSVLLGVSVNELIATD